MDTACTQLVHSSYGHSSYRLMGGHALYYLDTPRKGTVNNAFLSPLSLVLRGGQASYHLDTPHFTDAHVS